MAPVVILVELVELVLLVVVVVVVVLLLVQKQSELRKLFHLGAAPALDGARGYFGQPGSRRAQRAPALTNYKKEQQESKPTVTLNDSFFGLSVGAEPVFVVELAVLVLLVLLVLLLLLGVVPQSS